jgi:ABC-2 type transport system ATP-binding protein
MTGAAASRSSPTPAIAADHLAKHYGEAAALRDVTFAVQPGELFGLVGPDGSGKTTLLRVLATLLRPSSGTAYVAGIDVSADPAGVKRHIGYMSQRFSLSQTLSVLENLRYVAEVWGIRRTCSRRASSACSSSAASARFRTAWRAICPAA